MCFSASASFTVSSILTVISITSMLIARKQIALLGTIPLLFAVQQMFEGFIWTTTPDMALYKISVYAFLLFASVIWPVLIPLVMLIIEPNPTRKRWGYLPLLSGIFFAAIALITLIRYGATAIVEKHIVYRMGDFPMPHPISWILYGAAVVLPGFISSIRYAWLLSAGIIGAYLLTNILFPDYFGSVWCFFAAVISALVLLIVYVDKRTRR